MPLRAYLNQDFEYLKNHCLNAGVLFRDDKFPADDNSIYKLKSQRKGYKVFWKRPFEIVKNPFFVIDGITPGDLDQGDTGNCWFISAAATIASLPYQCQYVIPAGQSFEPKNYAGIFHFRFWQFGEWVDVVIDDKLPVDENGDLIYCHNSKDKNEFFGPLFEKAYAKLAGCYEFLNLGDPNDAMEDLTGAVCETFDITKCVEKSNNDDDDDDDDDDSDDNDNEDDDEDDENFDDDNEDYQSTDLESLWIFIIKSHKMNSLMNASFSSNEDDEIDEEGALENGLVSDHAYSLIQAVEFRINKNRIRLLKLRNPYGNHKAWKGAWSARSRRWKNLDEKIKQRYNLRLDPRGNGEFYISYHDFVNHFEELDVAHVNLNALFDPNESETSSSSQWKVRQFFGRWLADRGGNGDRYWLNPQYLITVDKKQPQNQAYNYDENQGDDDDAEASIIINLMQQYLSHKRMENNNYNNSYEYIKFHVYKVIAHDSIVKQKKFTAKKFNQDELELIDSTGAYAYQRSVTKRCNLPPGDYVIIPSMQEDKVNLNYLLRIFFDRYSSSNRMELF